MVQMMCLVYILLPTFKWMIFPNLGVAAVGLWGAFAYSARLTLAVCPRASYTRDHSSPQPKLP
jgi:uncharacterized membrane protein